MANNQNKLEINGRELSIELSSAAQSALAVRTYPLYVQMELYFSCLLRLKVRFSDTAGAEGLAWKQVGEHLFVSFRPVMTAHCSNDYEGEEPPVTDFPIAREAPFTPRWLHIDYRNGQWQGNFGYHSD